MTCPASGCGARGDLRGEFVENLAEMGGAFAALQGVSLRGLREMGGKEKYHGYRRAKRWM